MSADREYTPFDQKLAKRWLRSFLRKKHNIVVPRELINLIATFNTWGWDFEAARNGLYAINPRTPGMAMLCEGTTIANALSRNHFVTSAFHFEKGFKYTFTLRNHRKIDNAWIYGVKRVTDVAPSAAHWCHPRVSADGLIFTREMYELEVDCTGDAMRVLCFGRDKGLVCSTDVAWQLCVAGTESGTRLEIEHAKVFADDDSDMDVDME